MPPKPRQNWLPSCDLFVTNSSWHPNCAQVRRPEPQSAASRDARYSCCNRCRWTERCTQTGVCTLCRHWQERCQVLCTGYSACQRCVGKPLRGADAM